MSLEDADAEDAAPSRGELLQRAAALGPARPTYATMSFLPTDPVLGQKMQPRVVERRARLRRVVKVALGACVAFCLFATAASALGTKDATAPAVKAAPAAAVVPVEKLEPTITTKAPSHLMATARAKAKRH